MALFETSPTVPKHRMGRAAKVLLAAVCAAGGGFLVWLCFFLANPCGEGVTFAEWAEALKTQDPAKLSWNPYTPTFLYLMFLLVFLVAAYNLVKPRNFRPGMEHGSARQATPEEYNRKLMDRKHPEANIILSQNIRLAINTKVHKRNLNILMVAASGLGKTFNFLGPNLLSNLPMSYVITDPKKEVLTKYGKMLKTFGYQIKVVDLIDFQGDHYNPLAYITNERELVRQIKMFLNNTTPKDAKSDVPFWEKAENALWMGVFYYVWMEYPPSRRNFCSVIDLLAKAVSTKTDQNGNPLPSELQSIITKLEGRDPRHPAVRQLKRVLFGAQDTVNSIVQMAQARAASMDIEEVRDFLATDTLDIASLGFGRNFDRTTRTALFLCVPEDDDSYNFLAAMVVDQITQNLKRLARKYSHAKLPIPVMFFLDEAAQFPFPKSLIQTISVARSYQMSFCMIYQDLEQPHTQFGDSYKTLIGNMSHVLYMGGNSQDTNKYFSDMAGEQTLDKQTSGESRGGSGGSTSRNYDAQGRHLLFPEELRTMPFDHCVIFTSGLNVCTDTKYKTWLHENYGLSANDNYENEYTHDPDASGDDGSIVILTGEQLEAMGGDGYQTYDIDTLLGGTPQRYLSEYTIPELIHMVCHGSLNATELERLQAELISAFSYSRRGNTQ